MLFKIRYYYSYYKVGHVFSMVIWPELHTGQHKDGDHQEHAPYFTMAFTLGIVYRWL